MTRLRKFAVCLTLACLLAARSAPALGLPPFIIAQPQSQSVQEQDTATFSVYAVSFTTMTFQWLQGGVPIPGATSSSFTIANVQPTNAGRYSVTIVNGGGTVTSAKATLTVYIPPAITTQPQSQTVIQGDHQKAVFSVAATGTAPLNYQWYLNGSPAGGGNNSTLTINNPQSNQAGNYMVVVKNNWGSVTSAVATLTIYVPPTIQTQPNNATVTQGQSASFSVAANGTAPLAYQWSLNGSALSGATNASLTLTDVQATQAGSYTVVATNAGGSVTSQVATLTVDVPPAITTQPQNQAVILGDNQNASFSVIANGTAPLNYQWFLNGSSAGGGNNSTLTINNPQSNQAGNYTVVVQNNWGSVTSAVAILTVYVPPTIQAQPNNATVTQGQSASFSVAVSGTAPLAYQWSFNGSALSAETNSSLTFSSAQSNQAGSYTIVVTNSVGSVTSQVATMTVDVPPAIITQPQNQTVIQGENQNASFSVMASGTAPLGYQWNFNGSALSGETNATVTLTNVNSAQAGGYTVIVTNNFGSVTSQVAALTVYVPPSITTQPQSQTVIQGQNLTTSFAVLANGSAPLNYQWFWNNSAAPQETNSTLTLNQPGTNQAGSYTVVVQNNWGAVTSAVAVLTVYIPPTITNQPQSVAVFRGQTAAFSVSASGSAPFTYQWSFNDSVLVTGPNPTLFLTNSSAAEAGSYTVLVSNPGGSVTSAVAVLTVTNPIATVAVLAGAVPSPSGFSFQVGAPVGVTYIILTSPDLLNWTPIATNIATAATASFTDPAATNSGNQFYKVITP